MLESFLRTHDASPTTAIIIQISQLLTHRQSLLQKLSTYVYIIHYPSQYLHISYICWNLASWWFQPPFEKLVKLDHFPR